MAHGLEGSEGTTQAAYGLKGRNETAQGNALGRVNPLLTFSPERAESGVAQRPTITPLQGSAVGVWLVFPGRCPGLS
jgi:hypothetical protein